MQEAKKYSTGKRDEHRLTASSTFSLYSSYPSFALRSGTYFFLPPSLLFSPSYLDILAEVEEESNFYSVARCEFQLLQSLSSQRQPFLTFSSHSFARSVFYSDLSGLLTPRGLVPPRQIKSIADRWNCQLQREMHFMQRGEYERGQKIRVHLVTKKKRQRDQS